MPKFKAAIAFELEAEAPLTEGDVQELVSFITDALEQWGGQRHPDDWLFGGLENVKIERLGRLREVAKAAKLL